MPREMKDWVSELPTGNTAAPFGELRGAPAAVGDSGSALLSLLADIISDRFHLASGGAGMKRRVCDMRVGTRFMWEISSGC